MAVVFQTDISQTANIMAFNNNVIRFTSDTSGVLPLKADVAIGSQVETIYPSPSGGFYFNFLEYFSALVVINGWRDMVSPSIDSTDSSYTYIGESLYQVELSVSILLDNDTTESAERTIYLLAGVEQLRTYKRNERIAEGPAILLPLTTSANNKHFARYWEGYPFDLSFTEPQYDGVSLGIIPLANTTNGLGYSFRLKAKHTRLFFCDGQTDAIIDDKLPLAEGGNFISWEASNSEVYYLQLDKSSDCKQGPYFKFMNRYGGWSYWKFPPYEATALTLRNIGEIDTNGDNLADTFAPTAQIGLTASERLQVASGLLNDDEFNLLRDILTSPKIYLFTGAPFARASTSDWVEVRLATTRQTTKSAKNRPNEINLEVELPDYYTQTL